MGGGERMVGVGVLLSAFLPLLPPCLSLFHIDISYREVAEIVLGNNTRAWEFVVGSDVTVQCRVYDPARHNVTNMRLSDGTTDETFDVIAVGNDAIETTLYNVTLGPSKVIVCQEGPDTLTSKTLCVGYPPSQDMSVWCRLYPGDSLKCSVHTDQQQNTLCNVKWSLHYRLPQSDQGPWRPFPSTPPYEEELAVPRNVSWPDKEGSFRLNFTNITVRATASNGLGTARAAITFVPAEYAVPGPAEWVRVDSCVADPARLRVSWYHSAALDSALCEVMGGLSYFIQVQSTLDRRTRPTMKYEADCMTQNYRMQQHLNVTGLIPNTPYNVTITPRSSRFSGTAFRAQNTTSQSRPLKAPTIVGWSAGVSPASVVVYWKPLSHRYRGGPIVAHNISVTSTAATSQREDYYFVIGDDTRRGEGLVTSPAVLTGCSTECVVTVTSSTVVGASAPASVRISSRLKDLKMPVVYTERADSENRTVSWREGSVNVTSVAWCYGASFDEDGSLIQCQTELEERAVGKAADVRQMVIPAARLRKRRTGTSGMCENCRWHFAVRVTDTATATGTTPVSSSDRDSGADNVTDYSQSVAPDWVGSEKGVEGETARLVWNRCQYAVDGKAPVPEVKIAEAPSSDAVVVSVQSLCSRSPESAGRPIQAQLAYGGKLPNCSAAQHMEAKLAVSLEVYEDGAMRGQLRLGDLARGRSYLMCLRLRSRKGWGDWHQERFFYNNLAEDRGDLSVPLVCGLALLVLVSLCCAGCRIRKNLKQKSRRFSASVPEFTLSSELLRTGHGSGGRPQSFAMDQITVAMTPDMADTTTVPPPQGGSSSSKDSAFEENSNGSGVGIRPRPPYRPLGSTLVTSDPTSTAHECRQETPDDLGSGTVEADYTDRLLGNQVAEARKDRLPASRRLASGIDMSRPKAMNVGKSLQSPSSLWENGPTRSYVPLKRAVKVFDDSESSWDDVASSSYVPLKHAVEEINDTVPLTLWDNLATNSYIPLERAVEGMTEDNVSSLPEERACHMSVSGVPQVGRVGQVSCVPQDQGENQVDPYIPLEDALAEDVL